MNKLKILLFLILFLTTNNQLKANQLKILAIIDDDIITNLDFYNEKKTLEFLNKTKIKDIDNLAIINLMIEDKIKEIEINLKEISISENDINKKLNSILSQNNNLEINKNIKKNLKRKIKVNSGWEKLIFLKYRRQLEVNMDEINEIMKIKKIPAERKDIIVNNEKKKKINIFSKIYLNQLKKKYYIKKNI